jgi:PAS domain S-box-containing protein/putative nucleotidyltransferase with HDIG domain
MRPSVAALVRRERLTVLVAAMFAAIFALRMSDPRPADNIMVLCAVPIVICAIHRGPAGGVVASLVALALTVAWRTHAHAEISPLGYGARTIACLVIAVIVGRYAADRRAYERLLARPYEAAVDLQCIVGYDGCFKRVNPAWSTVLGYADGELLERPFLDLVHPDDMARASREALRLRADDGATLRFDSRCRASDGSHRWLAWTARSVGSEQLIYASARDVTEERHDRDALERLVEARTRDLEAARIESLRRLALAAEYRDDETHQHTERVAALSALLAQQLGLLPAIVEQMRQAAPLHDIGKLGIPDAILLKRGRLTERERALMQKHTAIGASILADSGFPVLVLGEQIARTHHERWDGTGYPAQLAGADIPMAGRIVAVADVFDALTHERPYKRAWPLPDAIAEIVSGRGTQFDPEVVSALEALHDTGALAALAANAAPQAEAA